AGHPMMQLWRVLSAWRLPPSQDGGMKIGSAPPVLAPAAFWGLGAIGLIACLHDRADHSAIGAQGGPSNRVDREVLVALSGEMPRRCRRRTSRWLGRWASGWRRRR